jgi:S1-C subfamily serine protease
VKHLLSLLLFAVLLVTAPAHAKPTFVETLKSKTVAIVEWDDGDLDSTCAGVWLSTNTFITAEHCVRSDAVGDYELFSSEEDFAKKKTRLARVLAKDPVHDVALLVTDEAPSSHGIATIAPKVEAGQDSHLMGHPLSLQWTYSKGVVSAIRDVDISVEKMLWVQTTAAMNPGNSGGGLFDNEGRLIGIASRVRAEAEGLAFCVHPSHVTALVAGVKK